MYLSTLLRSTKCMSLQNPIKSLSGFGLHVNSGMTSSIRTLSAAVMDRRPTPSKILSRSTETFSKCLVRHAHDNKMFDLQKLGIPKKLIGWQHRLLLRWKLGNQFDAESFFDGVMGAFLYVTECIASTNEEGLSELLIGEARQTVTKIMSEAEKGDEAYQVEENDIVVLKVTSVDFESMEEFSGLSDVTVLSMYVWIAYMKDCIKILEGSNPDNKDSWSDIAKKLGEMQKQMKDLSHHAEFKFQRAYDQSLEKPLTDWMISQLAYKIPKRTDEY